MDSPNNSPRARRRSPTAVQDTSPRRRRNRFDKNQQQNQQQQQPQQSHQQQQQQRRFPKLPPYHVLDVVGERGLFLIDGEVPVESLARMGLVLPLPWMPVPGARSPPPPANSTNGTTTTKSNRKQHAAMKNKSNGHKSSKVNANATPESSPTPAIKPRSPSASLQSSLAKDNKTLVRNAMTVSSMQQQRPLLTH